VRKTIRAATLASATALAAALAVTMTGCGNSEEPAAGSAAGPTTSAAAPATTADDKTDDKADDKAKDGMTTTDDVFGAACSQLPQDAANAGSLDGMVDDPVATAASGNPLLTKLVAAVQAAGLVDTLNKADAHYTVFAPYDPAFEALGPALDQVLTDKATLTSILTYHVVPTRYDKDGALDTSTLTTVQGGSLTVAGSGDDMTVNDAKVLCGNIPTANATVFVIDKVLMPTG
jgi:uncharacterized surface protein with fasciclin (FAS1) repeats